MAELYAVVAATVVVPASDLIHVGTEDTPGCLRVYSQL